MSPDKRTGPANGADPRSPGRRTDTEGNTPSLFDPEATRQPQWTDELDWIGDDPRRRGEADAVAGAARSWRRDAERTIEQLAARSYRTGEPFTSETVREYVGDVMGPSQNAMGGLFAAASKRGIIRACGYTTATREEAHGRVLRTWIGTGGAS